VKQTENDLRPNRRGLNARVRRGGVKEDEKSRRKRSGKFFEEESYDYWGGDWQEREGRFTTPGGKFNCKGQEIERKKTGKANLPGQTQTGRKGKLDAEKKVPWVDKNSPPFGAPSKFSDYF